MVTRWMWRKKRAAANQQREGKIERERISAKKVRVWYVYLQASIGII